MDLKHVDLEFKQCPFCILYDLFASRIPFTPSPLHLERPLLQTVATRHFLRNHIRPWPHTTSYRGPPQLHPHSAHNYTTNRARIALQHIHDVGNPIVDHALGHHGDWRRSEPGKSKYREIRRLAVDCCRRLRRADGHISDLERQLEDHAIQKERE